MKNFFKRLFAVALVAAMSLSLFACKDNKDPVKPTPSGNDNMFTDNDFDNDKNLLPARVKEVTITLAADATFKDGSTQKVCKTGDTLKLGEDIIYKGTLGEGKVIGGYFDENNVYHKGADFTVARKDVTLTPAQDVPESSYAPTKGGEKGGKIGTGEQRTDGGNNTTAYLKEWRDGIVDGEIGGVYRFVAGERDVKEDLAGNIPAGFCFTNQTPYQVVSDKNYTIDYRIQNLGDEDVTIRIRQSNSAAGAYRSNVATDPITIKAGEVKKAATEISGWNNGNVLNAVELIAEVHELNLGIVKNVSLFDPATKTYELTLLDGATIEADGKTSGNFRAGEKVALKYTPEKDRVLTGWVNADNAEETYTVNGFTMPKKNITLKPVTVENKSYNFTVIDGILADGTTTGKFIPGKTLTLTCDGVPAGKVLVGWYNVNERTEIYKGEENVSEIAMPAKDLTVAPLFDAPAYFYADKKEVGKLLPDGNVYEGKESGCYNTATDKLVGAVKTANGDYELGSVYRFKGGADTAPAKMEVGSHFLTQAMNNWGGKAGNRSTTKTVTYTVENFGAEDVTLRFALTKQSSNPNSQYGEATVTIKAGESVTFDFDVTYLHNSFMTNVMVKDHAVSEVYIGFFIYITDKA